MFGYVMMERRGCKTADWMVWIWIHLWHCGFSYFDAREEIDALLFAFIEEMKCLPFPGIAFAVTW